MHEEASRGKAKRKGDPIAGHCAGAGPTPLNQPWASKHQSQDHARPAEERKQREEGGGKQVARSLRETYGC